MLKMDFLVELLLEWFIYMPLKIIGVGVLVVVLLHVPFIIIGIVTQWKNHKGLSTSYSGYSDNFSPELYNENAANEGKSDIINLLDEQLNLEDEERFLGMDYGFLAEDDHFYDNE